MLSLHNSFTQMLPKANVYLRHHTGNTEAHSSKWPKPQIPENKKKSFCSKRHIPLNIYQEATEIETLETQKQPEQNSCSSPRPGVSTRLRHHEATDGRWTNAHSSKPKRHTETHNKTKHFPERVFMCSSKPEIITHFRAFIVNNFRKPIVKCIHQWLSFLIMFVILDILSLGDIIYYLSK